MLILLAHYKFQMSRIDTGKTYIIVLSHVEREVHLLPHVGRVKQKYNGCSRFPFKQIGVSPCVLYLGNY